MKIDFSKRKEHKLERICSFTQILKPILHFLLDLLYWKIEYREHVLLNNF
jgi:hypothetical protein